MASFAKNVRGIEEQNRLWHADARRRLGLAEGGVPYPTQAGGEGLGGPLRGVTADLAYIDETAGL